MWKWVSECGVWGEGGREGGGRWDWSEWDCGGVGVASGSG